MANKDRKGKVKAAKLWGSDDEDKPPKKPDSSGGAAQPEVTAAAKDFGTVCI